LAGDAVKNLNELVWISILNTFSTGDQALVLILSKRTALVRKCLEPPSLLLNAGTGHSGVVPTAVSCFLPGLCWLTTLSNYFSAWDCAPPFPKPRRCCSWQTQAQY